jgi:hypothetical protein
MLSFGVTIPSYYTAEVGNPGGTYELPCIFFSLYDLTDYLLATYTLSIGT